MATYAVIRIPDQDDQIVIPADSFEVDDDGALVVYRFKPKSDGTVVYQIWGQFATYTSIYLIDDDDDYEDEADEDEEDEDYEDEDLDDDSDEDDEEEPADEVDSEVEPSVLVPAGVSEVPDSGPSLNSVPDSLAV